MSENRPARSAVARHWPLDPKVVFLNHGSFGACPSPVLEHQHELRMRMEREPVSFLVRECEPLLDAARESLAAFVGAAPEDLAFVSNATSGVNAVLRSLELRPGDRLLTTDHAYNACRNALEFVAARSRAVVDVASIQFPNPSEDAVVASILELARPDTRLALIDHVTSPTALVLPVSRIVRELSARGIDTLVDGAHAPGMIPLDLRTIGAAWYTGNCHKWICAPKGSAFLHVRPDRRGITHPAVISHGARGPRSDRDAFRLEFDWTGTHDPTAWMSIPTALGFMGALVPGGWPEVMSRNRALARHARDLLCDRLGVSPAVPDSMQGSMAAVLLPEDMVPAADRRKASDPLGDALNVRYSIEVPVIPVGERGRVIRVSAQLYNAVDEYEFLAEKLAAMRER